MIQQDTKPQLPGDVENRLDELWKDQANEDCFLTLTVGSFKEVLVQELHTQREAIIDEVIVGINNFSESSRAETDYEKGAKSAVKLFRAYLLKLPSLQKGKL